MIYQFEHEGIKACGDCPCCDTISGCQLGEVEESFDKIPANCPIVAISKTETTACEWCELEPSEKIFAYGMGFRKMPLNYCPNCGRRLEGKA